MKIRRETYVRLRQRASTRTTVALLLAVVFGFAAGALIVYRSTRAPAPSPVVENQLLLSDGTKAVLSRITSPVELRFYALFGSDPAPAALREFASHVNELLSVIETEAHGKITVTRFDSWTPANTKDAAANGVVPFDSGTGDPSYIGVAVAQGKRKEALAQLAPEWASALEFDLARVISRVGTVPPPARNSEAAVLTSKAEETIKSTIPDVATTSLEAGKQMLRDASLKSYQALVGEMNREVQKAELALQTATDDATRQAASQEIQKVRAGYADKLREVAQQSQAQIEAWTRLKEK